MSVTSLDSLTWLDEEELRVFRAFSRSTRALFVQFDRDLQRDVGMPRTFFEILWLLNREPGGSMRMSELAEATGSQPSRITHAVSRLEQAGHVRREHCSDDRRGWFAVLTEAGREMLEIAAPRYAQSIRRHLLEPLSAAQQAQLTEIGNQLLASLGPSPFSTEVVQG